MNKALKIILICFLSAAIITIAILLGKMSTKLPNNPPTYVGNTSGNLQNRGLFVEDENYIYFANVSDSFRLCRMDKNLDNVVSLSKDSVEYLNLDVESKMLYYSRISYRMNLLGSSVYDISGSGIYRLQLGNESLTRLYKDTCGSLVLLGNQLVFQTHGDDGTFDIQSLAIDKEKQQMRLLTTDPIPPVCNYGEKLFYTGTGADHYLYSFDPSNGASQVYARIDGFLPVSGTNGFYFLSQAHRYALYQLPYTSSNAIEITGSRLCAYNIAPDNQTIYYQVDDGENNRLCRYDVGSSTEKTLMNGNYKNLNTVANYLFFTDFDEKICYCYNRNSDSVSVFLPDVTSK